MTTLVQLELILEPVYLPWVEVALNGIKYTQQLAKETAFVFEFETDVQQLLLTVTHSNKLPNDPSTAVIVKQLSFFGISDPKFIWQAQYRPEYPEPWFGQQCPSPPEIVTNANYLGWNGVWSLEFGVPVFTWIHQIQNLGWIYD
jgi:hypothetical protein